MLKKYGSSAAFRKQCSNRYLEFGVRFYQAGQISKGRRALVRSIALDRYRIQPYLYFALMLLGVKVFAITRETKVKVLGRFGINGS
jgi:hypothetical protein